MNKYFNTPQIPPVQTVLSDYKQDCANILNWFGKTRVPGALWGLTVCECVQRRCSTSAPGEPEIPQSADQPDAGSRGRTVQKHGGEFTTVRPLQRQGSSPQLPEVFRHTSLLRHFPRGAGWRNKKNKKKRKTGNIYQLSRFI